MRRPRYGPDDIEDDCELGDEVIPMHEASEICFEKVMERVHARVKNQPVFVSYDIDFLDPAYAPGTGTPEVGGPTSYEGLEFVRGLDGLNVVGFDLVEVLPTYDSGEITAVEASAIIFEMFSLVDLTKLRMHHTLNQNI